MYVYIDRFLFIIIYIYIYHFQEHETLSSLSVASAFGLQKCLESLDVAKTRLPVGALWLGGPSSGSFVFQSVLVADITHGLNTAYGSS